MAGCWAVAQACMHKGCVLGSRPCGGAAKRLPDVTELMGHSLRGPAPQPQERVTLALRLSVERAPLPPLSLFFSERVNAP